MAADSNMIWVTWKDNAESRAVKRKDKSTTVAGDVGCRSGAVAGQSASNKSEVEPSRRSSSASVSTVIESTHNTGCHKKSKAVDSPSTPPASENQSSPTGPVTKQSGESRLRL